MPIRFKADEVIYHVAISETCTIPVRFGRASTFESTHKFFAAYRNENVESDTVQGIVDQIQAVEVEAQRKADRAKALKDMTKNPIPAMLSGKTLTPVLVRGVPKSQAGYRDDVLITVVETGEKKRVHSGHVLRMLTDAEQAVYRAAIKKTLVAIDAVPEETHSYMAVREFELVVPIRHDADTDEQVAVADGIEFRSQSSFDLRCEVEAHFVAKNYPYTIDKGLVVSTSVVGTSGKLFKTVDDAQAYIDAAAAYEQANAEQLELKKSFQFDTSIFQDKD